MASRAQWRFGIFTVGLQMAIKLNQVKMGSVRGPCGTTACVEGDDKVKVVG